MLFDDGIVFSKIRFEIRDPPMKLTSPTRWDRMVPQFVSYSNLVQISPISLGFMVVISIVFMGIINQQTSLGCTTLFPFKKRHRFQGVTSTCVNPMHHAFFTPKEWHQSHPTAPPSAGSLGPTNSPARKTRIWGFQGQSAYIVAYLWFIYGLLIWFVKSIIIKIKWCMIVCWCAFIMCICEGSCK